MPIYFLLWICVFTNAQTNTEGVKTSGLPEIREYNDIQT